MKTIKKEIVILAFLLFNLILITNVYAISNGQVTHTKCVDIANIAASCPVGLQQLGNKVFEYKCEKGYCVVDNVETLSNSNQIINLQTDYISYCIMGGAVIVGFVILGIILRVKRK